METLRLRIAAKNMLTATICRFELRPPDGTALPPFTVGAHINVHTQFGAVRSYSLNNDPAEPDRYVIAVARDASGRGGSISLVDDTSVGDPLRVSTPVNTFPLHPAPRYLLIAGGIGITPIRAMYHHLQTRSGAPARMLYLTRSARECAYLDDFLDNPAVLVHHSERGRLDLWPYLAQPDDHTRIYCCGPPSLTDDVRALTAHWRPSRVHFEEFTGVSGVDGTSRPFRVSWRPTGQQIEVSTTETLLEALRRHAIDLPSSCGSGTCGTCRVRVVAGDPEHRDLVLAEDERTGYMMPCVSRARSDSLEIAPGTSAT